MGNLIAMLTHCARGAKAIVGAGIAHQSLRGRRRVGAGRIVLTAIHILRTAELDLGEKLRANLARRTTITLRRRRWS